MESGEIDFVPNELVLLLLLLIKVDSIVSVVVIVAWLVLVEVGVGVTLAGSTGIDAVLVVGVSLVTE